MTLKNTSSLLAIFLISLFSTQLLADINQAKNNQPVGERIESQSFPANFIHFEKVTFASYVDSSGGPSKAHYYLIRDGQIILELPEHYGNTYGWSIERVVAISFKDLNSDGLKDIIIFADYVTGIGPNGMVPFLTRDVYFQGHGSFNKNEEISALLNNQTNHKALITVKDVVTYCKTINLDATKSKPIKEEKPEPVSLHLEKKSKLMLFIERMFVK